MISWLSSIFTPGYSAHLEAQRQEIAANEREIAKLTQFQKEVTQTLTQITTRDVQLAECLTSLQGQAVRIEQAKANALEITIEHTNTLDKEWPDVQEKVGLLLEWVKFREGGQTKAVERFLEAHQRKSSQTFQAGFLKQEAARAQKEAERVTQLADKTTQVAQSLTRAASAVGVAKPSMLNLAGLTRANSESVVTKA